MKQLSEAPVLSPVENSKDTAAPAVAWNSVQPMAVFKHELRRAFTSLVPGTMGVVLLLCASCGLVYGVIETVNPRLLPPIAATISIPLHRVLVGGPPFVLAAIVLVSFQHRSTKCSISRSGFTEHAEHPKQWAWNECLGFRVRDEGHANSLVFTLFLKARPAQTYYIPRPRCAEIVGAIAEQIPTLEIEPPAVAQDTPDTDWKSLLAYFVLTLAFSLGEACLLAEYASKWVALVCLFSSQIIGPGTFSCLVLHPKEFWKFMRYRSLAGLSLWFNYLGFSLLVLLFAVLTFHRI